MANVPRGGFKAVAKGREARVWIWEGEPTPDNCPEIYACLVPGGVSYSQSTTSHRLKCPHPSINGKFLVTQQYNTSERPEISTSLQARLPAEAASLALRLTTQNCDFTMAWAYSCSSQADQLLTFDRIEMFAGARVSSYTHDEVGAFSQSSDSGEVLESIEIACLDYYEYVRPEFDRREVQTAHTGVYIDATMFVDADCDGEVCGNPEPSYLTLGLEDFGANKEFTIGYHNSSGKGWGVAADTDGTNIELDGAVTGHELSTIQEIGGDVMIVSAKQGVVYQYRLSDITSLPETGGVVVAYSSTNLSTSQATMKEASSSDVFGGDLYISGLSTGNKARVGRYDRRSRTCVQVVDDLSTGSQEGHDIRLVGDGEFSWVTCDASTGDDFRIHYVSNGAIVWATPSSLNLSGGSQNIEDPLTKAYAIDDRKMLLFTRGLGVGIPAQPAGVYYTNNAGNLWRQLLATPDLEYSRPLVSAPFIHFVASDDDGSTIIYMSPNLLCDIEETVAFNTVSTSAFTDNLASLHEDDQHFIIRHLNGVSVFNK